MKWQFWKRPPALDLTVAERYAEEMVALYEPLEASGEWKRHNVLALLIKRFPLIETYQLAMAIEQAVTRLREK